MPPEVSVSGPPVGYADAVAGLLAEFDWNPWFLNSYWPENEPRIRLMCQEVANAFPTPTGRTAFEVGCANGYVAYLLRRLGFEVSAADAYDDDKRAELFSRTSIQYQQTNLNAEVPLGEYPTGAFDVVLLGEVFEHILNQPAGLLRGIHRLLRPGGLLVLTTPNPSTLMNALRVLGDGYLLWGTDEFLRETKLSGERVIDRGDIHYREYPLWVVRDLLREIGFEIGTARFVRTGVARTHGRLKRWAKSTLRLFGLADLRWFAPGHLIACRKPKTVAGGQSSS